MQLADLPIPHLTDLDSAEQLALIRTVRERRRFVHKPVVQAKRIAKSAKDPLAGMTKEQLSKLLEVLTNGAA